MRRPPFMRLGAVALILVGAVAGSLASAGNAGAADEIPPLVDLNADVHAFDAPFHGDTSYFDPSAPLVGMAVTPKGDGYWLVGEDGDVFDFGDAGFVGSLAGIALNQPIVAVASHPSRVGFWMVASDGGVFSFGAAGFFGSLGDLVLDEPIVGMAAHPSGNGYWLVASDGGVFSFGASNFYGSMGGITLKEPVVGMAAHPSGNGYWLVASDGGIFTFGAAEFHGSTGAIDLDQPIADMSQTPDGDGYWLAAADGGVFTFGNAEYLGSAANHLRQEPVVAMASRSDGAGYWLLRGAGPTWPLTGLPARSVDARPALAIKIDNHPSARGQWGLQQADVVFEELVEGGATRLIAVFHSQDSTRVGPIRSARESDLEVLPMFGPTLLVFSGGNRTVRNLVEESSTVTGIFPNVDYGQAYYRTGLRRSPHNLLSNTTRLWPFGDDDLGPPTPVFDFVDPVVDEPSTADDEPVIIDFGTTTASWQWDGAQYVRSHGRFAHRDAFLERVSAANVLVIETKYITSAATGSPVVAGLGSGEGLAMVAGVTTAITWERDTLTAPYKIRAADTGSTLLLARGNTWVELSPEGLSPFGE